MSRVSILEQLRTPRKSALDFHYDELTAPPIMALFTQQDIQELYNKNVKQEGAAAQNRSSGRYQIE